LPASYVVESKHKQRREATARLGIREVKETRRDAGNSGKARLA
jgi:hypothetical protein